MKVYSCRDRARDRKRQLMQLDNFGRGLNVLFKNLNDVTCIEMVATCERRRIRAEIACLKTGQYRVSQPRRGSSDGSSLSQIRDYKRKLSIE